MISKELKNIKKDLDLVSTWGYRNSDEIDGGFRFEVNTIGGHIGEVVVCGDLAYNKVLFSVKALNLELTVSDVAPKDIIEVIDKLVKGKLSEKEECDSLSVQYQKEHYRAYISGEMSRWNNVIIGEVPWRFAGHFRGKIIVNDEKGLVLDFVKKALEYEYLKSMGKVHEITVDKSWPSSHDIWKRLCSEAVQADKGLLVINVENFNFLKYFWELKQLAKQEHSDDLKFCGFVLLVIDKKIKWKDVIKESENNYGQFKAMMQFYGLIDPEMFY